MKLNHQCIVRGATDRLNDSLRRGRLFDEISTISFACT